MNRKKINKKSLNFFNESENLELLNFKKQDSLSMKPLSGLLFENQIDNNLIDVETVGKICGVSPKTIHNWVYLRLIPHIKLGRKVMFRRRSLISWLNHKEMKP